MFGAIAQGVSHATHFLEGDDCLNTMKAFQRLGIPIDWRQGTGEITVHGQGISGLKKNSELKEIFLGNSGTSMRILLGLLAGQNFEITLTGDESLSTRPMRRVTEPLKKMGAQIKGRDNGNYAPLWIRGGRLHGIDYENKLGSAQVKSALLFAGLYAEGETRIFEFSSSRDHTERLLAACGAPYRREDQCLIVQKASSLHPLDLDIPGDISSAAFFIVGAAITPGSNLVVEKVGLNPTRLGLVNVLQRMGAKIEVVPSQAEPEPMGTIHIQGSRLNGTRVTKTEVASLIDELPILMIAMALAEGESIISGAEELRVKETDRIHSMVVNLKAVGGEVEELPDGCWIQGVERFHPGRIQGFGDHRTAMSFAIASLAIQGDVLLDDVECVSTSFPSFFDDFKALRNG